MFSLRLPSNWNVNATNWRVLSQWKQNEWYNTCCLVALGLEQRSGHYIIGGEGFDRLTLTGLPVTTGNWVNFAVDITYSGNPALGKVTVYADANNDGTYEYQSPTWTGQTLLCANEQSANTCSSGQQLESVFINGLYEGTGGDSVDKAAMSIWG